MSDPKPVKPVVEGWFTAGAKPALIGTRCAVCSSAFFPREDLFCRNPHCDSTQLDQVELSRTGTIWAATQNFYPPPPPYIAPDPFEPYILAAVTLDDDGLVVMGPVRRGAAVEQLCAGTRVELSTGIAYEDDDATWLMWEWAPIEAPSVVAANVTTDETEGSALR
ncbi:MAG: OB-fold domain-containing protein [Actinobacteria bacterium]|nr:OB-fold domain-containing protein [Actinomycetota bacterium]MCB9388273.1 OB-fold domain-containing protein [Acidimicrobiia bacterium]